MIFFSAAESNNMAHRHRLKNKLNIYIYIYVHSRICHLYQLDYYKYVKYGGSSGIFLTDQNHNNHRYPIMPLPLYINCTETN